MVRNRVIFGMLLLIALSLMASFFIWDILPELTQKASWFLGLASGIIIAIISHNVAIEGLE